MVLFCQRAVGGANLRVGAAAVETERGVVVRGGALQGARIGRRGGGVSANCVERRRFVGLTRT